MVDFFVNASYEASVTYRSVAPLLKVTGQDPSLQIVVGIVRIHGLRKSRRSVGVAKVAHEKSSENTAYVLQFSRCR